MREVDADAKTLLATPQRPSRWRRVLRISLMLVGTHLLAWGVGRAQGWWTTRSVEEKADRVSKALTQSNDLLLRFEAWRSVERAQAALEARNFGIAQEQVLLASRALSASHPPPELAPLTDALSKYQPVVTQDLAGQHQQLSAWLAQIDAHLPVQHP